MIGNRNSYPTLTLLQGERKYYKGPTDTVTTLFHSHTAWVKPVTTELKAFSALAPVLRYTVSGL